MKKLSVSMMFSLLLASLIGGAALASTKKPLPFKGSSKGVETYQENGPTMSVTATGSGEASQLGRYTVSYEVEVDLQTLAGTGLSAHFVAANGDSLFAEGSGQATPTDDPTVVSIVETYTITGGTGRFANASGSFIVNRTANLATGETSGSFDGTIVIP